MSVQHTLRHVEDLPIAPAWVAVLNFLILLLVAAAAVIWIGFSRNVLDHAGAAPGHSAGDGTVLLRLGGHDVAVPRALLRFPPAVLVERDPGLPYDHIELELDGGIVATIAPRGDVFTPAERLEKIYRPVMTDAATDAPDGLTGRLMAQDSVYAGDTFYIAEEPVAGETYFVRCAQDKAFAACYRTHPLGNGLTLDYRFPAKRLADWRAIERETARITTAAFER